MVLSKMSLSGTFGKFFSTYRRAVIQRINKRAVVMWSTSVTNMVRGLIPETLKYQYRQNIQKLVAKNQCQVPYSI
jgi:hypothetical protein